ncbi:MAG: sporulation protein, partial [Polynucleobacter sp.]|nr:sporulation protein [Polynucleobacter sp.]
MIRLPKLFNRNSKPEPVGRAAVDSRSRAAAKSGTYQRTSQTTSGDELSLTEDPDRQRARHRLIGAAVLVLLAVVGLPRILDSKPKAVNSDIAVNIVTSLPLLGSTSSNLLSNPPVAESPATNTPAAAPVPLDKSPASPPPAMGSANSPSAAELKAESKVD